LASATRVIRTRVALAPHAQGLHQQGHHQEHDAMDKGKIFMGEPNRKHYPLARSTKKKFISHQG
jgi:hypothetical protein